MTVTNLKMSYTRRLMFITWRFVLNLPIADSCWFPCIHHHQGRGDVCVCVRGNRGLLSVCLLSLYHFSLLSGLPGFTLSFPEDTYTPRNKHQHCIVAGLSSKPPSVHHLACSHDVCLARADVAQQKAVQAGGSGEKTD